LIVADGVAASGRYFLSYSRSDERFALRFAKDLRSRGVAMWVDQLDIRPSEHWDRAIEKAVRDCRGLVVIVSPRSVASDNVADEISYAIENGKTVLPVMIEKCSLPLRITRMHLIDASAGYERAVQQCAAELQRPDSGVCAKAVPEAAAKVEPEAIATAKRQLTKILGPIADIIVDKAARRASTISELRSILIQHIEDPSSRARFAAQNMESNTSAATAKLGERTVAAGGGPIGPVQVDAAGHALLPYLGPIAPIVAKRESRAARSIDEFHQRLASLIHNDHDRAAFFKSLKGG
jgi:hypothetical protein